MIDDEFVAAAVAAVREYLRLEGTGEAALLERVARAAIALGETFTGTLFHRREVEERVVAASGWALLAAGPVAAIGAVAGAGGAALPVADYGVDIDADGRGWVRAPDADGLVAVTYRAGLAEAWDALPAPLSQGVVLLAAHLFEARESGGPPPAAVAALWRPFRRVQLMAAEHAA